MFTDDENEYNSEIDDVDFEPRDKILNDLLKLSKKNNIKEIKHYIDIHRSSLNDYKAKLLNKVVNAKGYKFMRKDSIVCLRKIPSSSKYYKKRL